MNSLFLFNSDVMKIEQLDALKSSACKIRALLKRKHIHDKIKNVLLLELLICKNKDFTKGFLTLLSQ